MTSIEEHKNKINEHLEAIDDAIKQDINKIPAGKVIKHDWFKRPFPEQKKEPLVERKISAIFPRKEEIYNLIYALEEERNSLMYGKSSEAQIKKVIENFLKVKEILLELLNNERIEI